VKYRIKDNLIVIIMEDGENFTENIKKMVTVKNFPSTAVVVSALGMLKNIKLGYFDGKEYILHEIKDPSELLGISGVMTKETDPSFHFHIIIGDKNGHTFGGHLMEAFVCNVVEMFLLSSSIKLKRILRGKLKILDFEEN